MNIFKSIWNNPKVKRVIKKRNELKKKEIALSKELNRAKHEALNEHKRKHHAKTKAKHHRRYY